VLTEQGWQIVMRERRADRLDFVGQSRVVEARAATADRFGVATRERGE